MSDVSAEYFFIDMTNGSQVGPLPETEFREKILSGEIRAGTPVWRIGAPEWTPFEYVRGKWFPETLPPPVERLPATTSFGAIFSDTWNFLFLGNNFWLLLAGGILWTLIEIGTSFIGADLLVSFVTNILVYLVFLIFLRKWDRGENAEFADLFPFNRFFFRPWLRAFASSALSAIIMFFPVFAAGILAGMSFVLISSANPELGKHIAAGRDKIIEINDSLKSLSAPYEFPQISVETEHEPDEALPEVENIEVAFDNATLTEEFQKNLVIYEVVLDEGEEIAEIVAESPIFWGFLVVLVPLVALSIFFSVRLMFACYFPLDADVGVIDSLKYSWKLSSGNFWKIFIFGLILGALLLVGIAITFGFGLFILYPYALAAWLVLYAKLVKSRPEIGIPPTRL